MKYKALYVTPNSSADPEGGDRGFGPPWKNHKLYGFL